MGELAHYNVPRTKYQEVVCLGNSNPIRQHFIPVLLLKNFVDADGFLWHGDVDNTICTQPKNVFVKKHLYTKHDFINDHEHSYGKIPLLSVEKDYVYENWLSLIEDKAKPSIDQVLEQVRHGKHPKLSLRHLNGLKKFIITQAIRTPEAQTRVFAAQGIEDLSSFVFNRIPNHPRLTTKIKSLLLQNSLARLSSGAYPPLEQDILEYMKRVCLRYAVIRIPEQSFVIGSHGITIIDPYYGQILGADSWLPIAPDVAVGLTDSLHGEALLTLDRENNGEDVVAAINAATVHLSERIVGSSEALVRSLMEL